MQLTQPPVPSKCYCNRATNSSEGYKTSVCVVYERKNIICEDEHSRTPYTIVKTTLEQSKGIVPQQRVLLNACYVYGPHMTHRWKCMHECQRNTENRVPFSSNAPCSCRALCIWQKLCRWSCEKYLFAQNNVCAWFVVVMMISYLCHFTIFPHLGYSSSYRPRQCIQPNKKIDIIKKWVKRIFHPIWCIPSPIHLYGDDPAHHISGRHSIHWYEHTMFEKDYLVCRM